MDAAARSRIIVITNQFQIQFLPSDYFGIVTVHATVGKDMIQTRMKAHHPHQQFVMFDEKARASTSNQTLLQLARKTCVLIFTFFEEQYEGPFQYWWQQDRSIYAHAIVAGVHELVFLRPLLEADDNKGSITAVWSSTYELAVQLQQKLQHAIVPVIEVQYFEDNVRMVEKRYDALNPLQHTVKKHRKTAIHPKLHFGTLIGKSHVIWNRDHMWANHRNDRLFPWQFSTDAFVRRSPRYSRGLAFLTSTYKKSCNIPWVKSPIVRLHDHIDDAMFQVLNSPTVVCTTSSEKIVKRMLPMLSQVGIMGRAIQEDRIRKDLEHTITRTIQTILSEELAHHRIVIIILVNKHTTADPKELEPPLDSKALSSSRASSASESSVLLKSLSLSPPISPKSAPPISPKSDTSAKAVVPTAPNDALAGKAPLRGKALLAKKARTVALVKLATTGYKNSKVAPPESLGRMTFPSIESALGMLDLCHCLQLPFKVSLGDNLILDADFIEQIDIISPALSGLLIAGAKCIQSELPATLLRSVGVFDYRWAQARSFSILLSFFHRWIHNRKLHRVETFSSVTDDVPEENKAPNNEGQNLALSSFEYRLEMSRTHCVLYRPPDELMLYATACSDPPGRFPKLEGLPKGAYSQILMIIILGSIFLALSLVDLEASGDIHDEKRPKGQIFALDLNMAFKGYRVPTKYHMNMVYFLNGLLGTFTALSTWAVTDAVRTMFAIWVGDGMATNGASVWAWLTSVGMSLEERVVLIKHCADVASKIAAQRSLMIWIGLTLFEVLGRTVIMAQYAAIGGKDNVANMTSPSNISFDFSAYTISSPASYDSPQFDSANVTTSEPQKVLARIIVNQLGCRIITFAFLASAVILVAECIYYEHCWWWEGSMWQLISTSQPTASGNSCIVRGGCAPGSWWTFSGKVITFRDVQRSQNVGHLNLQMFDSADDPRLSVNWPSDTTGRCYG